MQYVTYITKENLGWPLLADLCKCLDLPVSWIKDEKSEVTERRTLLRVFKAVLNSEAVNRKSSLFFPIL